MEEEEVCPSLRGLGCRAGTAFAQSIADERYPLDTKCESNYRNFVGVIKSHSVIYSYGSDL